MSLHGHVATQVAELDLDEFLGVEGAVPVAAGPHRLGQHHPPRVHSLEQTLAIHPPSDLPAKTFAVISRVFSLDMKTNQALPDEHWRHPFCPKLFVNAQKVDFHHFDDLLVDRDGGRHSRDEPDQFATLGGPAKKWENATKTI